MAGELYYATVADVKTWIGDATLDDVLLTRQLRFAQHDIDTACGPYWHVYDDTGLKFATTTGDFLTAREIIVLMEATCAQVEYRLLFGDDYMMSDVYDRTELGRATTRGQVRKVSSISYTKLHSAGFLHLGGRAGRRRLYRPGDRDLPENDIWGYRWFPYA